MTDASHPDPLVGTTIRRGRSTLLDMERQPASRERPWALRRVVTLALLGCGTGLWWIVANEILPPTGPGYLLYAAHDHLWLPFWSWVWMRSGFWSLLWFGPLAVLLVLVLVEFLGLGQPLRRLQVAALRLALRRNWTRGLLVIQQMFGWSRQHESLLVCVIDCDLRSESAKAMAAVESGRGHDVTVLCRMILALAYLRATSGAAQIRCAEQHLLAAMLDRDTAVALGTGLRRIWGDETADRIEAKTMIADEEIPVAIAGLSARDGKPDDLALLTLGIVRCAILTQPDAAGAWFTRWAQLRCRIDPRRNDLAAAERLLDFEFWAAVCEGALAGRVAEGGRMAWLPKWLPGVAMYRSWGELAAAGLETGVREMESGS